MVSYGGGDSKEGLISEMRRKEWPIYGGDADVNSPGGGVITTGGL
jgi:hypothetical protein